MVRYDVAVVGCSAANHLAEQFSLLICVEEARLHDLRSQAESNAVSPGLTCFLPFGDHLAGEMLAGIDG
jgi:hypothetical protein